MDVVQRYGRAARWFHVAVYLLVLGLLATGWWFVLDRYRHPVPGSDVFPHETAGLALIGLTACYALVRLRAALAFVRESVDRGPGDGRWLAAWPRAVFTGRFPRHDGYYDPGQRLANIVMVLTLALLAASGLGLLYLPLGTLSSVSLDVHRWATFALTPVVAGHIVVASGVLPGYRGVWRSMHLGGRLPATVAGRIWPGWLDQFRARQNPAAPRR